MVKNKKYNYKKLWLLIILSIAISYCSAQVDTVYTSYPSKSLIFHTGASFSKMLHFKHYGALINQQKIAPAFIHGIEYSKIISNNTNINFGVHFNFNMVERTSFKVYSTTFNVDIDHDDLDRLTNVFSFDRLIIMPYYQIPVSLSQRKVLTKFHNTHLNYTIGIGLNYITQYEYGFGGGKVSICGNDWDSCDDIYSIEISNNKPLISPSIMGKIGILKVTKRGGYSYGLNLLANYTPIPVGKGTYEFSNIDQTSYGDVEVHLNYIGLEFVQGITLKKDNIATLYKNNKPYYIINDTLEPKNQLKLSVMPMLFGGMEIKQDVGEKVLESRPSRSIACGISYYQTLKDNLGINAGLQIGGISEHQRVNMLNWPNLDKKNKYAYSWSNYIISHYISLPISLQMTFKEQKKYNFIGALGISPMYIKPYKSDGGTSWAYGPFGTAPDELDYTNLEVKIKSENLYAFGVFAKTGIVKNTENAGSSLELNLIVHYSPTVIAKGEYNFTSEATDVFKQGGGRGTITQNINYIGLEMVYGLTLKKQKK